MRIHGHVFTCESGVCAFTGECQSFPDKEKEGIWAVCTYALCKSCVGAAEGSAVSGAACVAGWVSGCVGASVSPRALCSRESQASELLEVVAI